MRNKYTIFVFHNQRVVNIKNKSNLPNNVMVFQAFAKLAVNMKYTPMKILFVFLGNSNWKNKISVDISMLIRELKVDRRTITSGLRDLEDFNIIIKEKDGDDGRRNNYTINPSTVWKGSSDQRRQKIAIMKSDGHNLGLDKLIMESKKIESPKKSHDELIKNFEDGSSI